MNGYKAFYLGKETEIYAESSYEAQKKAIEFFKPRKKDAHMVHVQICEKQDENGEMKQIVQMPLF